MKSFNFLILFLFHTYTMGDITVQGIVKDYNGNPVPNVSITVKGESTEEFSDASGKYIIKVGDSDILIFSKAGFVNKEVAVKGRTAINVVLKSEKVEMIAEEDEKLEAEAVIFTGRYDKRKSMPSHSQYIQNTNGSYMQTFDQSQNWNTEEYSTIHENFFKDPVNNPLSTFSIDVDAASYSNVRRFINNGQMPPKDAVRVEEMINYFNYDYESPEEEPFSVFSQLSKSPWNEDNYLLHLGIKGKDIAKENLPPSNLVFLLDVSGSMNAPNKLPLLKSSFKLLVGQLRPQDRVAIVVYAGAAGEVLPSTSGSEKDQILSSLDNLQAGGSTAGGAGIKLAYKIAKENFVDGGNNRIILATDGDFNIGESSNASMERLIEEKRKDGVFLTVLGFGMGNYKDSKMEILADKGNGNYAYIDNISEAKKVLINEFGGTLFTIAKDVKIQIEFNPTKVAGYRLIGYENRVLNDEDFNDDKKDAGELGAGHTVTALYEIIPAGVESPFLKSIDDLEFQKKELEKGASKSSDIVVVKLRYKDPDKDESKLIKQRVKDNAISWNEAGENLQWSSTVASFGMILRDSEFKGSSSYEDVLRWAKNAKGADPNGYRSEFIRLVESCSLMARK